MEMVPSDVRKLDRPIFYAGSWRHYDSATGLVWYCSRFVHIHELDAMARDCDDVLDNPGGYEV